jgi:8-oxo-dGTP diphosphatase
MYHAREAVYAVIPDNVGRVAAVIANSSQLWLPGGGIEIGETPEQALAREVEEECAQRLHIVGNIGEALQYFYARSDARTLRCMRYFMKGLSLDRRQDTRNTRSSGSSLTIGHPFSMPVTHGQPGVFARQERDNGPKTSFSVFQLSLRQSTVDE